MVHCFFYLVLYIFVVVLSSVGGGCSMCVSAVRYYWNIAVTVNREDLKQGQGQGQGPIKTDFIGGSQDTGPALKVQRSGQLQ